MGTYEEGECLLELRYLLFGQCVRLPSTKALAVVSLHHALTSLAVSYAFAQQVGYRKELRLCGGAESYHICNLS